MQYFPLFVDTQKLKVLIVGGGEVAARKLDLLARTNAEINLIAPEVIEEILLRAEKEEVRVQTRAALPEDMPGWDLVYLATDSESLNLRLAAAAKEAGGLVNVVDTPRACDFITPSIVDRGRMVVAISTAGAAPVFARQIRAKLEAMLPQSLSPLLNFVASRRDDVQQRLPSGKARRIFWERFFQFNGDRFDSQTELCYDLSFNNVATQGELLLLETDINPELLPLAVVPLLQRLDAVYAECEIPEALNELLRRDASRGTLPKLSELSQQLQRGERLLVYADKACIDSLRAHFPEARFLQPGAL
ncbi:bifunctional precorrin-2 dehydrogenase/sirohydrochlorin ferrochelatase [Shewanella corallii]|uniref:precorrin-2 dehydrogenase n=1 Tax=Shewanella corallii TaxID=560080 RepID=A0ABT0NA90_9GAMM|nr:bifunctional precorrin-2 dehydrogenase/sirohydrochlorin ferrochelatase [Shewanella corallii]MCL2915344.1 bifunctional precorrin-2 dehydrogenase/sirohydrochlorin ferrochelatase [Shewanella corallii]